MRALTSIVPSDSKGILAKMQRRALDDLKALKPVLLKLETRHTGPQRPMALQCVERAVDLVKALKQLEQPDSAQSLRDAQAVVHGTAYNIINFASSQLRNPSPDCHAIKDRVKIAAAMLQACFQSGDGSDRLADAMEFAFIVMVQCDRIASAPATGQQQPTV